MLAIARAGKRLVSVGERGIVLLSDDAGAIWRQARVPVSVTLTAVQFVSPRLGWATGHLGCVLFSSDAGETWTLQLDGIRAAEIALNQARLAGSTKDMALAEALVADGPDKPFLDLHFDDERVGHVVGAYGLAFRTQDGGRSWQSWMSAIENPKTLHLYGIARGATGLVIVGEQGLLLSEQADGRLVAQASPSKGTLFGLVFQPSGGLIVYGLRGKAFRLDAPAAPWAAVDTGTTQSLIAATRLPDGRLLLFGQGGDLLASADGGRTFVPLVDRHAQAVTAAIDAGGGHLVLAGFHGLRRTALPPA